MYTHNWNFPWYWVCALDNYRGTSYKLTLSTLSQIQVSRGEQYAQQVDALFCETSALDATNVEELFIQISEFYVLQ